MFERIDLHTHSSCSDGLLSPAELIAAASARRVQLLALTDHDTVSGCDLARRLCEPLGLRFIAGAELTASWREREIHIIGLKLDVTDSQLQCHTEQLQRQRHARVEAIGARLTHTGLPGAALVAPALTGAAAPTRAHVARALVAAGAAADVQDAFDRWLNRGRPAYVATRWPALEATVQCIGLAGGLAVLAHPHRYRLSNTALRELCHEFKTAGGAGIEVSLAGMGPNDAANAASLARRFELCGSIGSDFHEPGLPWRPLGRFAKLPEGVTPITTRLGLDMPSSHLPLSS
ncbi:MAG: PHP domain-containing protein [Steroidobacterales bacterium]